MVDHALARAAVSCARCGHLAEGSGGEINFCPKCGADLRGSALPGEPPPAVPAWPSRADEDRTRTHAWIGQGQVIADRYRLIELLGEGGMGAVFKAEHIRMGKALALKLLRGAFARDPAAVARFMAEARIVSRLSHPHTIAVFDFGEVGDEGFYLAMEYVPGKDLAALVAEQGKLGEDRVIGIAEQILGSLAEAHEAGVVHRDVKPANVMVVEAREGDFVKVLDFGIAKLRDARSTDTTMGVAIGTPSYLAPEQARAQEVDGRADLYSVGALLYELVSGRPPFVAEAPLEVVAAHLHETPRPLREVAPDVSPGFAEVVHRALAKHPEERFESAHSMREALLAVRVRSDARQPAGPPAAAPASPLASSTRPDEPALEIARRADFAELERERRVLGRSRAAAFTAAIAVILLAAALVAWRRGEVYALLARRAPRVVAAFSPLRPPELVDGADGAEHEPNGTPAQANRVVIPPAPLGAAGKTAGRVALVRGSLGARLDARTGDVDLFRLEVPETGRPLVLVAEWSAAGDPTDGVRGLDVKLTLNRDRKDGPARRAAPLVTQANRRGPGWPERLAALVEAGTYYLAVRETHADAAGPVERPADPYLLRIWLEEPRPGEELEPDDAPESAAVGAGYLEWKAIAERNSLGQGGSLQGETGEEDDDTYAVATRGPAEAPELVLLVPEPALALTVQLWLPDEEDRSLRPGSDRVRFAEAGEGAPGEVLALKLPAPGAGAPALVRLRAAAGDGRYHVLALGKGPASGPALLRLMEKLGGGEEGQQALEMAASFARLLPAAAARDEVLAAAGRLAERLATQMRPDSVPDYERAAKSLGRALFEVVEGKVRYGGAFETLVSGAGPLAEEARLRAVSHALPCTADEVARRARAFLARFPRSVHAGEVRLALARAEEDAFFETGHRAAIRRAVETYAALAEGKGKMAAEARDRVRALARRRPEAPAVPRTRCEP